MKKVQEKWGVVDTVLRCMMETDPEKITLEMIAQRSGTSSQKIVQQFGLHDDIRTTIVHWLQSQTRERLWRRILTQKGTPHSRIRSLVRVQLRVIQLVPSLPAMLLAEGGRRENEFRRMLYPLLGAFLRIIAELVEQGQRNGEFRPEISPESAAFRITAVVPRTAILWSQSGRTLDLIPEGERRLETLFSQFLIDERHREMNNDE